MAKAKKKDKEPKRYVKNNLLQARVDLDDFKIALTKAALYTKGNLSEYVRKACIEYKGPIKKVEVK